MARPQPERNPEYLQIILSIMAGKRTPKMIRLHIKHRFSEWNISKSNFSMKLKTLQERGFLQKEGREFFVLASGLAKYIEARLLNQKAKGFKHNRGVHRLLFVFLNRLAQDKNQDYSNIAKISLHGLLSKFVLAIGFEESRKYHQSTALIDNPKEFIAHAKSAYMEPEGSISHDLEGNDWIDYQMFKFHCRRTFLEGFMDELTRSAIHALQYSEDGTIDFRQIHSLA